METNKPPKVFISYTWEDEAHNKWVMQLATDLRKNGVDAILDQWETKEGKDLPHFMDTSVETSDRVICVLTPKYKEKADTLKGGAGYEYHNMTAEMFGNVDTTKFIPLLRKEDEKTSIPIALKGRVYVDMRDESTYEEKLEELLRDIFDKPKYKKPELGPAPVFD